MDFICLHPMPDQQAKSFCSKRKPNLRTNIYSSCTVTS